MQAGICRRPAAKTVFLWDVDFQLRIRMGVTPVPVRLLIGGPQSRKFHTLAVSLVDPHFVGRIFMRVPFVVVVVGFIVEAYRSAHLSLHNGRNHQ